MRCSPTSFPREIASMFAFAAESALACSSAGASISLAIGEIAPDEARREASVPVASAMPLGASADGSAATRTDAGARRRAAAAAGSACVGPEAAASAEGASVAGAIRPDGGSALGRVDAFAVACGDVGTVPALFAAAVCAGSLLATACRSTERTLINGSVPLERPSMRNHPLRELATTPSMPAV